MSSLRQAGSPHNLAALPDAADLTARRIEVHDLTLEGDCEEMAGVALGADARISIARHLDAMGVPRLSVLGNSPQPSEEEIANARAIVGLGLNARLSSFVKTSGEIDITARIGLWGTVILIGVNARFFPPGRDIDVVIEDARRMADRARSLGLHTSMMAMDTSRAAEEDVHRFVTACEDLVDEFVVCDSMGVASPWGFGRLVEQVRGWTQRPLQVHCHNHSGVGVANVLAAVRAGADIVHTCVNGWGEFAGQPALDEVAVALDMHLGIDSGLRLGGLTDLAHLVADAAGLPLPVNKPVTGPAAFAIPETEEIQEAFGMSAAMGDLDAALTFPPALVGNRALMSMGRKCSRHTIAYALARRGLTASDPVMDQIAAVVRATAAASGYYLMTENTFDALLASGGFKLSPASIRR
ncbi:MAG: hypothetical protein AAGH74_11645 [Pseudomonadota bacterium]